MCEVYCTFALTTPDLQLFQIPKPPALNSKSQTEKTELSNNSTQKLYCWTKGAVFSSAPSRTTCSWHGMMSSDSSFISLWILSHLAETSEAMDALLCVTERRDEVAEVGMLDPVEPCALRKGVFTLRRGVESFTETFGTRVRALPEDLR